MSRLSSFCRVEKASSVDWLIVLLLLILCPPHSAAVTEKDSYDWLKVGKSAAVALEHQRYGEALQLYRKAVEKHGTSQKVPRITSKIDGSFCEVLFARQPTIYAELDSTSMVTV